MKKLLLVSFVVLLSFGFTLTGDKTKEKVSECPYLNKIHSQVEKNSGECPFTGKLESKVEKKDKSDKTCPYLESLKSKSGTKGECPYSSKNKQGEKSKTKSQTKIIQLKSS